MAKKKLSPKLKDQIKQDYKKLKADQFSGEALRYYNQVKSLAKARKVKASNYVQIGDTSVKKTSEIYGIVEKAAKMKGQTVKQFIKDNKEDINRLAEKGSVTIVKEADYVEKEIGKLGRTNKVYVNGKKVSKAKAKYIVSSFKANTVTTANVYDVLNMEISYDLKGNLYLDVPEPEEYFLIEDEEEFLGLLDSSYPGISYIRNDKNK
jgi:hypothetical protein